MHVSWKLCIVYTLSTCTAHKISTLNYTIIMVEEGRFKCGTVNENTIFETFIFHDTSPQIQHQNVTNLCVKSGEEENGGQKSRDESNIIQKVENW